ncbi:sugar ABC transporter permease [Paenibacillus sp. J31TS4]|uniref:extracellular solute-binding protein n=1 Tax=Paenibacillus sp. J31TS4 TaxID=2807195 RepID=UPI001B2BA8ED|nr:extracellular solute-binding protein [Paenibacillus sp. J31TS4]GIP38260.1 sugar ABC transporter permease [Paenibacillus sp. J31TS4]
MKANKWFAAAMTVTMAGGLLAGCGGGEKEAKGKAEGNVNATGFPIVKEPITLKFFTGKSATTANDWSQTMLWQEYAKMTNVNVDFQLIPFDARTEKRNLALASGDYPDAFYTAAIPREDVQKYGSQGTFIKLNDLIDKYAPNFKKLMDQYPDLKKGITMPDGGIYTFPQFFDPEFTSVRVGKLWINKDWLAALNMKEPTTTDELYAYLKAVKTTDLNKNGKNDEIGYGAKGVASLLSFLNGSFGLNTRGSNHAHVDIDPATKQLRFIKTDDRYKEQLQFVNKLYKEGLLDPEIFTINDNQFFAKGAQTVYGTMSVSSPVTLMKQTAYVGTPVLKGPRGDQMFTGIGSPVATLGSFAITDKNKNPEATVRWIDYFYGEEGAKMFFLGFKDKSYKELPDGNYEYTDEIAKNPNGLTLEQALVKYVTWPGGGYPSIVRQKTFKGAESLPESVAAAEKYKPYLIKDIWPPFTYAEEDLEKMRAIENDINTYITETQAKFIKGDLPFTEWDNYKATLKKMGVDEYMKIYAKTKDALKLN